MKQDQRSSHTSGVELSRWRVGIDLGGTKIAAVVLNPAGEACASARVSTPRHDYGATIRTVVELAQAVLKQSVNGPETPFPAHVVGIAIPGSVAPATGYVQNANSTWLNGKPFADDLAHAFTHPIRLANDADCFALSEASDGAAQNCESVFGVILGTGCGGGLISRGHLVTGPRQIGGEWGHNPLPWPQSDEFPGPTCWCGRTGCIEAWVSGPGVAADHLRRTGQTRSGEDIMAAADAGDARALETSNRHADRLARGLALVTNIFDPEMIVLGGGLSKLPHLYELLPDLMAPHIFADSPVVSICPPKWGDASGVRGAARLWDERTSSP